MSALEEYKMVTFKIIKNAEQSKDSLSLAKAYSYLADYYGERSSSESAYDYNFKAFLIYSKKKDMANVAKTLLNKAVLLHNERDFLGCERAVFQALKTLRNTQSDDMTYQAYNLLGVIYAELAEYVLSRDYYNKALEISNSEQIRADSQFKASTLNNIGTLLIKQKKYEQSLTYFSKALAEKDLYIDAPSIYAMVQDNLGYAEFKLKKFKHLPLLFDNSLKIRDSIQNVPGIIGSKIHLSEYHSSKNEMDSARVLAQQAYDLAVDRKQKRETLSALKQLIKVKPENAVRYAEEYYTISDTLQLRERTIKNRFARIEYQTEELAIQKEQLVEQRKTLIYSALGIILIGVFIFVIRLQRAKNRELRLIKEQQKANEEIYNLMITQQQQRDEGRQLEKKRIARELHDGVMGQLSAIRMNLFALDKKQDEQTIRQCLPHIEKIQHVEKEIRNIAYDLDAPLQSNTDFTEVIHTIFAGLEQHSGIRFVLEADDSINWNSVLVDTKVQLYRILQEALQNIVKYANAGKVMVSIGRRESMLRIIVRDDGVGFDPEQARKGLGLRNMRQRAQGIGGNMTITTALGAGTMLQFELPDTTQV
ncbi:MAG: hypothetical protein CFE23_01050 [Flavobacterium sp. BFFFF1]|nr:MAG: hypothetical protein CFE23_01050 [Flavobacterium sp. BFFFF1]